MVSLGVFARKFFGSAYERRLKVLRQKVAQINALEEQFVKLSDEQLCQKTDAFRKRLSEGENVDSLLPEAFATVREAAKRVYDMRPFDVQLIGGMVLHDCGIAEMRTGEGKTLMATLPIYLNALEGKGVHVVTVNDYLASRDAETMGKIFSFLGMTTGVILHDLDSDARRAAYACDITYATNNELGFDYLRDNMAFDRSQMVQRGHHYAIVDEVDSILIDEARTPLIISGPLEDRTDFYNLIDTFIPALIPEDYEIDEKQKTTTFTEVGTEKIEKMLEQAGYLKGESLYDIENVAIVHHVNNALKAHKLFVRDKDYIVRNDEIVIIDEFTGRMMPGRRYSEGLHQALEAKEHVAIQPENQTLASITFQNYFRMYRKLSGMTGTAATEAEEFRNIYGLDVVEVPTNLPVQRLDEDDEIYRTAEEKYRAIVRDIRQAHEKKQPILVGTTSIEKSEQLAERLRKEGITDFKVLNARYHEQEAYIIAQAGVPGALTIATNMAGRGTDIQLGGNVEMRIRQELQDIPEGPERTAKIEEIKKDVKQLKEKALAAGGLYVIATERHESRRIDNQLRGRSGRQGDPGRSKFFLSLQDDLMRIFGSNRMDGMLQKLGLKENEAIIHPWINKALEKAQKKVEARNFEIRKNLLKYDDVMNDQRKVIFEQRMEVMNADDLSEMIHEMRNDVVEDLVETYIPSGTYSEKWDVKALEEELQQLFNLELPVKEWAKEDGIAEEQILERILDAVTKLEDERTERYSPEVMAYFQKAVLLETIDTLWRENLVSLDHLRSVVGFRGYAQRDPLNEYKTESFELFQSMLKNLRRIVTSKLMRFEIIQQPTEPSMPEQTGADSSVFNDQNQENAPPLWARSQENRFVNPQDRDPNDVTTWGKVGRNERCPCGSEKKYKHCHGAFV
ncbi:preprotein translocase subunit SecA [Bartonella tribocorum]|uniref:Protein translocase subunit SecA n=1 Tax=Bartonella tribocorum (strain DSM 28219 / CCUG 45778 / CIP 105476 / IBS 506) TaxID=382640 RepID=SECA_BART1|nr:preprotein translocase subunit SecA [Bartonella tribocorum]A9IMM8.1 RecName: Full=Protein translocase subunit SecA [Bartonella tribocorum CIP 105476]CAK00697.1 translocase SecA subunit protein precursor [Bartonella tribocorum CIP 105476]CDO47891.1 preprotein translocase subunit SecA [Bartonella tribocorum]